MQTPQNGIINIPIPLPDFKNTKHFLFLSFYFTPSLLLYWNTGFTLRVEHPPSREKVIKLGMEAYLCVGITPVKTDVKPDHRPTDHTFVTSICLYACDSSTLTAELQRRIQAMEMRCYRKILRISYKDHDYQRGSLCQDPAGNWTTRRPPDYWKETQTAVVWSCFPFIRSGKNHLARHSERGKKTRQTEEEMGRQHQGMDFMDRPGVRHVTEGSGELGKIEETGCEIICGTPMTLVVKG